MKTNKYISTLIAIAFSIAMQAQNVGINNTGTAPSNSAELDLNTGNTFTSPNGKGLIIPNVSLVSTTDATTIGTGNVASLLVYNTNNAITGTGAGGTGYYYWSVTAGLWINLVDNLSPGAPWLTTGNAGTTASSSAIGTAVNNNFVGTTDANDFVLAADNLERVRLSSSNAYVGVNNKTPTQALDVVGNVRFSGALMPNNLAGTTGQLLISQGAGVAPIWSTTGYAGQFSAMFFSCTGATQKFEVPSSVTQVTVELWGGGGGMTYDCRHGFSNQGGSGAYAYGIMAVTPGQVLTVIVGAGGSYQGFYASFPDGGAGGCPTAGYYNGDGGGRSSIQVVAGTDVICAGGGGGGGSDGSGTCSAGGLGANGQYGGGGAGAFGGTGSTGLGAGGGGGSQAAGGAAGGAGATAGTFYTGVGGGAGSTNANYGGGGGGGYYGGGGGGANGGGGGGSSWYNAGTITSPTSTAGTSGALGGTATVPAPNNASVDYNGSASYGSGIGGGIENNYITPGGPGQVVIHW
jgi:hypothetical protein